MRLRYKDLSLHQLRTFREICQSGSYSEVARELRLSTSAVWEQMRGLDRYFGVNLLETAEGRVQATADGALLLNLVGPMLSGLESARETLHQLRGELPERLTIVSGMRMLMDEVMGGIVRFQTKYPQVRIEALYAEVHDIDRLIKEGRADLALALERGPEEMASTAVQHEFAYEYDFLLICPRGHPLLRKRSLNLADIVKSPLVVGSLETRSRIRVDEVFHRYALSDEMKISLETNSTATTFAAVRAGVGIGIAAAPLNGKLSEDLGVRSLGKWFGKARYVFIWKKGAIRTPLQQTLSNFIREQATLPG